MSTTPSLSDLVAEYIAAVKAGVVAKIAAAEAKVRAHHDFHPQK